VGEDVGGDMGRAGGGGENDRNKENREKSQKQEDGAPPPAVAFQIVVIQTDGSQKDCFCFEFKVSFQSFYH
jgi:hypothetical protein